jgi:hypothetical protein
VQVVGNLRRRLVAPQAQAEAAVVTAQALARGLPLLQGEMTLPFGAGSPPFESAVQGSSAILPSLSSGIELLLEGSRADPGQGVVEALAVAALLQIGGDDAVDRVDHVVVGEGRADDLADGGVLVGAAAERDLVELLALLVDAEDADVADVVVAAGVDAAGDLDLQIRRCRAGASGR